MKIVCIADTHGSHEEIVNIPNGDVFVVAGDFTNNGALYDVVEFSRWMRRIPIEYKIVVAGNHDWCFENHNKLNARKILKDCGIIYLQDESVVIDDVKFYGSPWQPKFYNWAFNLPRGNPILEKWKLIPSDTDVLITHGPPKNILDLNKRDNFNCGCEDLREEVLDRIKPKVHIFGHIHQNYGKYVEQGIKFVNAALLNESYCMSYEPYVIEV